MPLLFPPYMNPYESTTAQLRATPRAWLVTGVAGFIGSNLLEALLRLGQRVTGLDNFATGHRRNLNEVRDAVGAQWANFNLIEGDIRDLQACRKAVAGADYVLHHAALGSVPGSIEDPLLANAVNVDGYLNVLVCARDAGVKRFVYAASSSTYGNDPAMPKTEDMVGGMLSPYAVTKHVNDMYAQLFGRLYGVPCIGLRYFNVFGPRQDPAGAYAAVIPKWMTALLHGEAVHIHGDGGNTRDFCFVADAVQANLLAAASDSPAADGHAPGEVYNIALGGSTSLNELYVLLREGVLAHGIRSVQAPVHDGVRPGDVRHSRADIAKAQRVLGYIPRHSVGDGLKATLSWFAARAGRPTQV